MLELFITLLTYLLGLPLAVYTLAGAFALIDLSDKSRALALLTSRLLATLVLLLLVGVQHWVALLAAFLTVALLHLGSFAFVRLGVRRSQLISKNTD